MSSSSAKPTEFDARFRFLALGAILAGVALRLWAVPYARFTGDESNYWAVSRLLATGQQVPVFGPEITGSAAHLPGPLYYYLMAIPQALGPSPWFGSIFVVLLHALAAWLLFRLAERAAGPRAGLIAVVLLMFAPWDVLYADRIWGSCVVPPLGALAFYASYRAHARPAWQGLGLCLCLVLPQLHMSSPILWAACGTLLVLRWPQRWSGRSLGLGLTAVVLLYLHPMISEFMTGFANTKTILANAGGAEPTEDLLWVPLKVFSYAVLYGTSEIGYHFGRGYWGGFNDGAAYLSWAGWRAHIDAHGVGWALANIISILVAILAWGVSIATLARQLARAMRSRSVVGLDDPTRVLAALLVGLAVGSVLMFSARKLFFPHYANILMPMMLLPVAFGLDSIWARGRLRGLVVAVLSISALAMLSSCIRYYRSIDGLNGMSATVDMVEQALSEEEPVALRFDHFNNRYAWNQVARVMYGRPLRVEAGARIRYRVRNGARFDSEAAEGQTTFGAIALERTIVEKPRPPDLVFRATEAYAEAKVWATLPDGTERACSSFTGQPPRCAYGDQPWQRFTRESLSYAGRREQVLFMHPISSSTVTASFPAPKEAVRGRLTYGLTDPATQSTNTSSVGVRVVQGDAVLAEGAAGNVRGLRKLSFDLTSAFAPVQLEITTESDGARVFGFELELFRSTREP